MLFSSIFANLKQHYTPASADRKGLESAIASLKSKLPITIPLVINGYEIHANSEPSVQTVCPGANSKIFAKTAQCNESTLKNAIRDALAAKSDWENMPLEDRCSVFLKAADLISGKYRYELMAATMIGQGKNAWQAEIDAAAELCDFLRFNCTYAQELYSQQPPKNAPSVWNRVEYRSLEGFVYAISPFNFTAIGGNLVAAPALLGNVVIWKPSPSAVLANYITHKIFLEAGLPPSVIQFCPGDAEQITKTVLDSKDFAALHFTGSTLVFKSLYKQIAQNLDIYKSYPRIVGETGGKNFHVVHASADVDNAVFETVRAAYEYSGQKCSACSRAYIAKSVWENGFEKKLISEIEKLKLGAPEEWKTFVGPVIHENSFKKLSEVIERAKADKHAKILVGGNVDKSVGWLVHPTVVLSDDAKAEYFNAEYFGPFLAVYVYEDKDFENTLDLVSESAAYGLTGAVFAKDRYALAKATDKLRNCTGNFYVNTKCTGAVVGQQPFGGGRASGTNDKAGSIALLYRFVSMRAIKESFVPISSTLYPSNE